MTEKDIMIIQEIKSFLDSHLYEDHSIPEICRKFSVNKEKLQNGFKYLTRFTVHSYVVRRRMLRAEQRLRESNDSIKLIALECGYKKQRSFNKTFKSIYHTAPAVYRVTNSTF